MPTFRATTSSSPNTNTRALVLTLPAGTVAVTSGSKTVTGTSTEFTKWLKVGDDIFVNSERKKITAIASDTSLTVDSNYASTVSGQTLTYFPSELKKSGNRVVNFKGLQANTGNVLAGESRNYNAAGVLVGDGSDITATNRVTEILPTQQVGPVVVDNLYNLFIRSSVASQVVIIDVNA